MKPLRLALLLLIAFLSQTIDAQKYAVFFKDKNGTPYTLSQPEEFLSQRALERRGKFDIKLTPDDLPVNPAYVTELKNAGATVLFSSRWLNCTLIHCDAATINPIKNLPCVDSVVLVYPEFKSVQPQKEELLIINDLPSLKIYDPFYGYGSNQIEQINGIKVHQKGYDGDGVLIAILDAGFSNANKINAFAHLYDGRLLMAKDFIEPGGDVYRADISGHGTNVLSCMATYLPNQMVGTAPKASYCLFRTEDTASEYVIEEYAWVIGAEAADSIGADLINSSLSYTQYHDPAMSHSYPDMDGQTTIASVGARRAVERGIFVCVSAGNSGDNASWRWIGTPADVVQALTVGAVHPDGERASFSSIGPNAAGEQKPNVMAQGVAAAIVNAEGQVINTGNGTSYSSPIVCGMVACLLQASPFTKPEALKNAIEASSSLYTTPSYLMGYGIPDFYKILQSLPEIEHSKCNNILIYPNPVSDILTVKSPTRLKKALLYDVAGQFVAEQTLSPYNYKISTQKLSAGMYIIHFYDDNGVAGCSKFIKE
ncbi:MAG: S8 family peptidase [Bacteroidales bacterium]|nr:S8 family peptidase [Bacteroidales bacterium]